MQQIKTKELPVDYFVTDTYYPSGNVEFIKPAKGLEKNRSGWWEVEKILGTKHIQLIAANITDSALCRIISIPRKTWSQGKQVSNGRYVPSDRYHLQKKRTDIVKQGKDFFVYKISEEK